LGLVELLEAEHQIMLGQEEFLLFHPSPASAEAVGDIHQTQEILVVQVEEQAILHLEVPILEAVERLIKVMLAVLGETMAAPMCPQVVGAVHLQLA